MFSFFATSSVSLSDVYSSSERFVSAWSSKSLVGSSIIDGVLLIKSFTISSISSIS